MYNLCRTINHILAFSLLSLAIAGCGQEEGPGLPVGLATMPSGDAKANYGSTGDQRLAALPGTLKQSLLECEAGNRNYDLGSQMCTSITLAPFECIVDTALKSKLDPSTVAPLTEYLNTKAADLILYACTLDSANVSLHFYKFEGGVVYYRKLNVARAP